MSTATRPRPARALLRTLAAGVAALGLLGAAGPAHADSGPPQLSIRVDDGRTDVVGGATLRYTLTVTNLGGKPVHDLVITQTVPGRSTLDAVDDGGTATRTAARWTVDLPPGRSLRLRSSVTLGKEPPAGELRLATVACASTSPKAPPVVCASDSDQLPAGAAAAHQQQRLDATASEHRPAWLVPAGLVAGGLLLVGAAVTPTVLVRRRGGASRRRQLVPHEPR